MRPSSSSALRPLYCQATAMTGMLMEGKMSVGVRAMTTGLTMRIRSARTMNVYGRSRAIRTIHIGQYSTRVGVGAPPWGGRHLSRCPEPFDVGCERKAAERAEALDDLGPDDVDLHRAARGAEPRGHGHRPHRHGRAAPRTWARGVDRGLPIEPRGDQRHRLRLPRRAPAALAHRRRAVALGAGGGRARPLRLSPARRVAIHLRGRGGGCALP